MLFHLVYSRKLSAVESRRKLTHKLLRQATELMVTIDHEFVGNSTSPPLAFHFAHLSHGHIASFGEAAYKCVLGHIWVQKTQFFIVHKR